VITGEGTIDRQTGFGKAVAGVAAVAAAAGKPCLAVGGRVRDRNAVARIAGLSDVEAAAGDDLPDDVAMREAGSLVQRGAATLLTRWQEVSAQA
jgi:glycerate kinase